MSLAALQCEAAHWLAYARTEQHRGDVTPFVAVVEHYLRESQRHPSILGTTAAELASLTTNGHLATARCALNHARLSLTHRISWLNYIPISLQKANATLADIGTSEAELRHLYAQTLTT